MRFTFCCSFGRTGQVPSYSACGTRSPDMARACRGRLAGPHGLDQGQQRKPHLPRGDCGRLFDCTGRVWPLLPAAHLHAHLCSWRVSPLHDSVPLDDPHPALCSCGPAAASVQRADDYDPRAWRCPLTAARRLDA